MFEIEQTYDHAALTALCRASRKTVRRWIGVLRGVVWGIFVLGSLLMLYLLLQGLVGAEDWTLIASLVVLLAFLLFEDRLNAWVARRNMIPGTAHSVTVFEDGAYTVTTDATATRWEYTNVTALCETERYFFFFLGKRHGQIFDKQGFRRGSAGAFREFVEEKTGKTFQKIK